ncbi:MAG: lamin tail domain-containing protein, partial [Bacteroidetes bacterium]|nr:lamin tail domain-containing protein [Bacteroidota bacterium]
SAPTVDRYAVIINEILFEPLPENSEWVELFNRSDTIVDISNFALAGAPASSGKRSMLRFPDNIPPLRSGQHAVIAADSSILTRFPGLGLVTEHPCIILGRSSLGLGNSGDEILLLDEDGKVIDSIAYDATWHHPFLASTAGRSLELLHPTLHGNGSHGWGSCTDPLGGTPGRRNSIHSIIPPEKCDGDARLSISPIPFSPDGDGFEDYCIITCTAPTALSQARLRLYDVNGRTVRTLVNNAPMGRSFAAVWDGLDDDGRRVRIGPYVALLELLDASKNIVSAVKGIVVVAMRL